MTLRDHPLMVSGGKSAWPPVWVEKYGTSRLTGEIGTLTHLGNNACSSNEILLHITHSGLPYCGTLSIQDSAFCWAIYELLREQIGRTIEEIGDLDLSYTL